MLGPIQLAQAFSPAECHQITEMALAAGMGSAGLVRGQSDRVIRSAQIAWLDGSGAGQWVMQRVVEIATEANRSFGFDLSDFAERSQVAQYQAGSGHFDWHADTGGGDLAAKRKLTLVAQLSPGDAYQGGVLETWTGNKPLPASRDQGSVTLFPAFTLHRVTPVTAGERWSLTTWVHGPAFR